MNRIRHWRGRVTSALTVAGMVACGASLSAGGDHPARLGVFIPGAPGTLGALSDPVFLNQEINAEASDFVVYDHEFTGDTVRLNYDGEDHVKQIAARTLTGAQFPIIVERSFSSPRVDDPYQFPIHPNPELDERRRLVLVKALQAMNVFDADRRVIVAPALTPGLDHNDIRRAHINVDTRMGFGQGGAGGFGGAGGGFGGFGLFF